MTPFYKNYKGFKLHEFISTALDYDYSLRSVEELLTLDEDNLTSLNSLPAKYKKFSIMYEDHCSKVIQEKLNNCKIIYCSTWLK